MGASEERALVLELSQRLRSTERVVRERCGDLAAHMMARVGRGQPLTELGDRVATPLQTVSDATKGCNPPFTIDAQGNKVFKTKCL